MKTITFNPPCKKGDKIYVANSKFGSCNFLERYSKYKIQTIKEVKARINLDTDDVEYYWNTEEDSCWYSTKPFFSKEELFESFREEIEQLIPEELRNYLWK